MIWQNFKMALASIGSAKLRSFLTMLGIIIGVSAVTSVIAIGEGVKQSVTSEVNDLGTNLIQISPGKGFDPDAHGEGGGGFNPAASLGASTLTEADLRTLQQMDDVEAAAPFMIVSGIASTGGRTAGNALIMATTPDMDDVINLKMGQGKFFTSNQANEVVLGFEAASRLFDDPGDAVGKNVEIRKQKFEVIGVLEEPKEGSLIGGGGFNNALVIPLDPARQFNNGSVQILELDAKIRSADRVDAAKQEMIKRIKANHGGQDDFTVLTQEEQLGVFDTILQLLTTFIAAIAAISLVVGGVGIMNIMLVSVTERTREIGIRKAIGASRRMILTQFLIEAVTLSAIGGALGVAAAYGQGMLVQHFAGITPVFTLPVFALAVGVSSAVGIIFGMAPAIKAARMRPIQALRHTS